MTTQIGSAELADHVNYVGTVTISIYRLAGESDKNRPRPLHSITSFDWLSVDAYAFECPS